MTDSLTNDGIELFLAKFKNARGFNSKEIRLTIQEAEELSIGIALLLNRYAKLSDKVIELEDELSNPGDTTISGGKF